MKQMNVDKLAEQYAQGKGHEHYNFLFEENSGNPVDFAKLCYKDGYQDGLKADLWKYPSKGKKKKKDGEYLIAVKSADGGFLKALALYFVGKGWLGIFNAPYAWQSIEPPKL